MVPKMSMEEIIQVVRDMTQTVRQLYGQDTLVQRHKLRIVITGGGGDYSVAMNVSSVVFGTFFLES